MTNGIVQAFIINIDVRSFFELSTARINCHVIRIKRRPAAQNVSSDHDSSFRMTRKFTENIFT